MVMKLLSRDALRSISKTNLNGQDLKVLLKLLALLDFENILVINQSKVAQSLNMNRHNVNRSIKKLIDLNIIISSSRIGTNRAYRLNPDFS